MKSQLFFLMLLLSAVTFGQTLKVRNTKADTITIPIAKSNWEVSPFRILDTIPKGYGGAFYTNVESGTTGKLFTTVTNRLICDSSKPLVTIRPRKDEFPVKTIVIPPSKYVTILFVYKDGRIEFDYERF